MKETFIYSLIKHLFVSITLTEIQSINQDISNAPANKKSHWCARQNMDVTKKIIKKIIKVYFFQFNSKWRFRDRRRQKKLSQERFTTKLNDKNNEKSSED